MNYKQVEQALADRAEFKYADRMSARVDYDGEYLVFSYTTLVAIWNPESGWWITDQWDSQTTSRQLALIRRVAAATRQETP